MSPKNLKRFYLVRLGDSVHQRDDVAATFFIKTSGDTVACVYLREDGKFDLHRNGKTLGLFSTVRAMFALLDRMDA